PTGQMAIYKQMRYNPAKGIGFSAIEAAAMIKVPMLLVLAEKEELMDNKQNGAKVYEIIKAKKNVPVALHTIQGITHYGIYREGFDEATKLELEWFRKQLTAPKPEKGSDPFAGRGWGGNRRAEEEPYWVTAARERIAPCPARQALPILPN